MSLQEAFDDATQQYKARIGDERSWLEFHLWLDQHLRQYCEEHNVLALNDVESGLGEIAKDPELLDLYREKMERNCRQHRMPRVRDPNGVKLELIVLQKRYHTFEVDPWPVTDHTRKLDAALDSCARLPIRSPLQEEVHHLSLLYTTMNQVQDYTENNLFAAANAQAVLNGVFLWLARHLGPVPIALLRWTQIRHVTECLERSTRQLRGYPKRYLWETSLIQDLPGILEQFKDRIKAEREAGTFPSRGQHYTIDFTRGEAIFSVQSALTGACDAYRRHRGAEAEWNEFYNKLDIRLEAPLRQDKDSFKVVSDLVTALKSISLSSSPEKLSIVTCPEEYPAIFN